MKSSVILAMLLIMTISGFAQQALWGTAAVVSPEIHSDNTVTFRLKAPNARQVQLVGDMLSQGTAEMAKDTSGVWEFTTPSSLQPELYSYSFVVDGLKITDPSNVYQNRDVASVVSVFIIGGERADLYKVNDVPHGTVSRVWYDSPTLGTKRRMTVYTPAGYEDGKSKYPVFYLLHGMGGDEEAWMALGRTSQILDNLIAQGKAKPMIVVMTNGNVAMQAAPGESPLGFSQQPTMQLPKTMEGSFETAFPDVVNYVEKHYRVIQKKSGRAIAGLSMGGFHSLHISKQYPEMFGYVGLFSAAIIANTPKQSPIYENFDEKLAVQFAHVPTLYWIAIGKTDFLYEANRDFRKKLDDKGYKYIYFETEEGHIWKNWRIYLTEFVPQLFK